MRAFLAASMAVLATIGVAQELFEEDEGSMWVKAQPPPVVLTSKRALFVLPPQLIIGQRVESFQVSPTGRFVVAMTEEPSKAVISPKDQKHEVLKKFIVIWDSVINMTKQIPLADISFDNVAIQWFAKSDRAIIIIDNARFIEPTPQLKEDGESGFESWKDVYLFDAEKATATPAPQSVKFRENTSVMFSPSLSLGVVLRYETQKVGDQIYQYVPTVQRLNSNGVAGKILSGPLGFVSSGEIAWSADGRTLLLEVIRRIKQTRSWEKRVLQYDPLTEELIEVTTQMRAYEESTTKSDILLVSKHSNPSQREKSPRTWSIASSTKTDEPEAQITQHADSALMAPSEKFVVFQYKGALFVSPLVEKTLDEYQEILLEKRQDEIKNLAKQCVLGMLMFAADNDDIVPATLDLMRDLLPYIKKEDILRDFVYTFKGGDMSKIESPATTEVGYIPSEIGRAVAYADGHVEWIPNA